RAGARARGCLAGRRAAQPRAASSRAGARVAGQRAGRRCAASPSAPAGRVARRLAPGRGRDRPALRGPEPDAGPARLRQPDRDRLPGGTGPVLAIPDVVHLLADELAGLRRRRLALGFVLPRALQRLLVGHGTTAPWLAPLGGEAIDVPGRIAHSAAPGCPRRR